MRRLQAALNVALIGLITGVSVASPPQRRETTDKKSLAASRFPAQWLSETTGNVYRVVREGEALNAVEENLPRDAVRQGAYVRTELRRAGDKWVGTTRSYLKVTLSRPNEPVQSNWCHLTTRTEMFSISSDRITGRAEAVERIDASHCRILHTQWKDFVWKPVTATH